MNFIKTLSSPIGMIGLALLVIGIIVFIAERYRQRQLTLPEKNKEGFFTAATVVSFGMIVTGCAILVYKVWKLRQEGMM